jgi:oligopeptide/dipeptide ABC transporter ATP-binding protein
LPEPALIELDQVRKHYPLRHRDGFGPSRASIRAVDGVSLQLRPGRTVGLVGESGCGKSTTIRLVLGIEAPTEGEVRFEGHSVGSLDAASRRHYRRVVQAVFQDPWGSLNPRIRIGASIAEPLIVGRIMTGRAAAARARELLEQVGLQPGHADRFPHEFSGGQRQRIAIARALAVQPRLLVLDEPLSALDVSIRAQIINLLRDLQEQSGLGYLFVAHQLFTVWSLSDEVAVMYLGQIVEYASADAIRTGPLHPYTRELLAAALPSHPRDRVNGTLICGEMPSVVESPAGCRFHTRCRQAISRCLTEAPQLREVTPEHRVACFLY